jgi:hypothetical protein
MAPRSNKGKNLLRENSAQALLNSRDVSLNTIGVLLDSGKIHTGITMANPQRRSNFCEIAKEI